MTGEKMLYVKSNDFWGYDASDFDSSLNFYTYTWTVPESMYNGMDDSDQGRLFPCALFYVQGVTDNHNFLTLSIDVDGADAKVRGMQGAKRRTLKFEKGVPYAYSVGSLSMKEAPAGSTSIASIEEAVKDGSATMTGVFNVDSFLTEASEIATAVGLSTTSSAESYEAEVSDFYPQSYAEIGNEQSGRGVPVAYGSGSSQYVEPPVVELEAEVSDFYPQSSAEIGDEQSGRGVPVAYGSGSSQYVEPPVVELSAEVSDFYPQSSAEIGDEQSGRGVPVAYGSGSSQYVEPPVVELSAEIIDDDYMDAYSAMGEPDAEYDQGYNDQLDESLGMRDGAERDFRQSMKDRRDESKGTEKYDMSRPYSGVDTMDAQGYNDKMDESLGMRHRGRHSQSMKDRRDEAAAMDRKYGMKRKYEDVATMDAQGYDDKMDESLGMRHRGSHSQSMKSRRNEAAAMDRKYGMKRKYEDVMTMDADGMITEGLPVIPDSYGTNSALSSGQGVPVWYGSADGMEDYNYQSNDGSLDSAGFTEGTVNPTEFTRLGAYDVPVIPNSFGEDSSEMGYGVPQWYGADTMVDNFEESAPPMNMGKKTVGLMAIVGLVAGAYMASRK